ncbi:MAG: tryptophan--tRNA ligase [Candidatus Sungbacteria bacterium]|nr:tryptophan--tRNA ligase [Candidatus Sungbacteria bacterium]
MTILSGMRPTGKLHLGQYFGALKNWVELQAKATCYFMVADYHALTTPESAKNLREDTTDMVLDWLAAGLDPERCVIFRQSDMPEHTELAWIFETLTPMGELERMVEYKEKSAQMAEHGERPNVGLLAYPVLQAADILIYKADAVPVGQDQAQHIELARTIARKFNDAYKDMFPEPKELLTPEAKVMSLTDPTKKMSKSLGEQNAVNLADEPDTIARKIQGAVSDIGGPGSGGSHEASEGGRNLLELLRLTTGPNFYQQFAEDYEHGKLRYAEFKPKLAEAIAAYLEPIRTKRSQLEKDVNVSRMLSHGATQAREVSAKTLHEVKEAIGLL